MSEFEEVKRILDNLGQLNYMDTAHKLSIAKEICQLFPPYQDAQWSDKEGHCFWCKSPTHWVDVCYEGYVCSAKCQQEMAHDVKSRSELEPGVEREFEVWSEGYSATGECGPASLLGMARACTFKEACDKVAKTLSDPRLYDSEKLTYWGCGLFDNKADARRSFG